MNNPHKWTKAKGRNNFACACGCTKQLRSIRTDAQGATWWHGNTFYATPEQQAKGTRTKTCPPCWSPPAGGTRP